MLTQDQKDKLQSLMENCSIPKLKKVLESAIPKWISGEIIPVQGSTGLNHSSNNYVPYENNDCCLIGTALIGKKFSEYEWWDMKRYFDLSNIEIDTIIATFDNTHFSNNDPEIQKYVREIRIVLFGE